MKKLSLSNGVVMAHPFELAELLQNYSADNFAELLSILFSSFGVLSPTSEELKVSVDGTSVTISPGRAYCAKGPITVDKAGRLDFAGKPVPLGESSYWVNIRHKEEKTNPVQLYPYGTGNGNQLVRDSYVIEISETPISLADGVPLAQVIADLPSGNNQYTRKSGIIKAGVHRLVATDRREDYAAKIRYDALIHLETIDPILVSEVNKAFSRDDLVADLFDLLDLKMLQGEEIVTRPLPASQPLFVKTNYEPAFRQDLRIWSGTGSKVLPSPSARWRFRSEWNLYGLSSTRLADAGDGKARFQVTTEYDLSTVDYASAPVFVRYNGEDYEIDSAETASIVKVTTAVGTTPGTDSSSAIHNGGAEFFVSANNLNAKTDTKEQAFVFDDLDDDPAEAELVLAPGSYQIAIQSISDSARGTYTYPYTLPKFPSPASNHAVVLTGEVRQPGRNVDLYGTGDIFELANPFSKLAVGADGEAVLDTSELDRYVDAFEEELRRIQEVEVVLKASITPPARVRSEKAARSSLVVAYDVDVQVLTSEGWKSKGTRRQSRPIDDVVNELSWLDVNSDRYRGDVAEPSALQSFVPASGGPLRSDDVVFANTGGSGSEGIFRYEPLMTASLTTGLDVIPQAADSSDSEGYWVRVSSDIDTYQPQTLEIEFSRMQGGADYRVFVSPVSESGQKGASTETRSEDLRDAYNARLGFNFHRTLTDMYQAARLLLEQVDPDRIDELIAARMNEIREIIERAALYGNPPKIEGPLQIPAVPPATTFVGTNLGSVNEVLIRYTPVGQQSEQVIPANFKVVIAPGAEPSIVITDLPSLSDLNPSTPAFLTMEFNAGVKGKDYVIVGYALTTPRVFGPNIGEFKGTKSVDLTTHKVDNTASFYTASYVNNEIQIDGPNPKEWADPSNVVHPTLNTEIGLAQNSVAPWLTSSDLRVLRFSVKNFNYSDILDARILSLPGNLLVKANWYGEDQVIDYFLEELENRKRPHYQQLVINPTELLLIVHKRLLPQWRGKNFVLEYAYYSAPIDGTADDCKGLILENKGSGAGVPSGTPQDGWYYYDETLDQYRVYRASWVKATPVGFARHAFSVNDGFRPDPYKEKQLNAKIFVGVPYEGPSVHPQYGYPITQRYSKIEDIYDMTQGAPATADVSYVIVDGDGNDSATYSFDFGQAYSSEFYYGDARAIRMTVPTSLTGADPKGPAAPKTITLQKWEIYSNGQFLYSVDAGGVGTYEHDIRGNMRQGGGVTLSIVPIYS